MRSGNRPRWWGGNGHIVFTIVVFVILASLDNAAIGIVPPLFKVIARDLSVTEASLGIVTAVSILITAVTALMWGYWGDQRSRKLLLLYGTLIWGVGTFLTGISQSFVLFLAYQLIAAVGLGCILSVGFSVVSDFISPRRRGLVMSFWGVSQGMGTLIGSQLGSALGADNWHLPFLIVAGAGLGFAGLYLFTYDPKRGRMEPELSKVFDAGGEYDYRIERSDIPRLARIRSNIWLILQGFTAQFAYGSLIWLPTLFIAKVEAEGYSEAMATRVGNLFAAVFQVGALFSILGGYLGDLWQRRDPRGRAMLSAIGILGAIPLYVVLFFLPMSGLDIPKDAGYLELMWVVLSSIFTNGWIAGTFLLALGALALTSVDSPNWFALISDVNLPEHRGTVFGSGNFINGVGRAFGAGLAGLVFAYIAAGWLDPPWNYAVGLALFQLFFVPTAFCYYQATKTTPRDIADVKNTLVKRAKAVL